mmetsp:Transcript_54419/g.129693  ORF Transcript_54419/g.129693 Transcript_54419/m.129693 type:complete len:472 (+) Transcript_54419:113-1528(+)
MSVSPVDEVLQEIGFGRFQVRMLLLCAVGYFGVCSELLVAVFLEEPLMHEFGLTTGEYAYLPFTVSLCSFTASFLAGKVADWRGRSPVFVSALALVAGGGFLCAVCRTFWSVIMCRAVVGIGLGALAVVDYVTFQEFSPPSSRRRYLYCVFAAGCLGVLYLAGLAAFTSVGSRANWPWLVIAAALPTVPIALLRCQVAMESPHFLASRGDIAAAYKTLQAVAERNGAASKVLPEAEFARLVRAYNTSEDCKPRGSLAAVLSYSPRRLTVPLTSIWLLQSLAYWGLTLFLPRYFSRLGVAANRTIFLMVACELPGCMLSGWLIDHPQVGQARMMRLNYIMAAAATLTLAFRIPTWTIAILTCIIYLFLIPNWGILFIYTPESYPTEMRATAVGFYQTLQGIPAIFSPFLSARLVSLGDAYMFAWGVCLLTALAMSLLLETRQPAENSCSFFRLRAGSDDRTQGTAVPLRDVS